MSAHWISIYTLIGMFVLATVLPINMGVIAFVGAFLVGTLVAGMNAKAIMGGFPADLFLTLVGITYLFALAQNNGTIDWLVKLAVRAVRGRIAAIPWIMFFIAALLTAVGAVSPGGGGHHRPHRARLCRQVRHQSAADGPDGRAWSAGRRLLADQHLRRHQPTRSSPRPGLPLSEMTHHAGQPAESTSRSRCCCFFLFGGMKLLRQRADASGAMPAVQRVAHGQGGPRSTATAEGESFGEEAHCGAGSDSLMDARRHSATTTRSRLPVRHRRRAAGAGRADALLQAGHRFRSHHHRLPAHAHGAQTCKSARSGQVSWPEIMLIVGVSTYVGVMDKMGTIDFVGHSVAGSPRR
jgi:hypothetical protein